MRGARRGDLIQVTSERLPSFSSEAHDRSPYEVTYLNSKLLERGTRQTISQLDEIGLVWASASVISNDGYN